MGVADSVGVSNCTAVALLVAVGVINYYTSLVVGPPIVVAVVVAPAISECSPVVAERVSGAALAAAAGPVPAVEQALAVELRVVVDAAVRGLATCRHLLVLAAAVVD